MTPRKQLQALGISFEADGDLIIVETERTFLSLTPREMSLAYPHLKNAYAKAQRAARRKQSTADGMLVV